jgi:isoleucyl-tRNA synthetase
VTEELKLEGIAREFINKIQNLRKDSGFEVTDRINLTIARHSEFNKAILIHKDYICTQTLASELNLVDSIDNQDVKQVEIDKDLMAEILVEKVD